MKPYQIASSILAASLLIGSPHPVFAHVGHGDEFQAEGGISRVGVNAEMDSLLGIAVTPIESASDGSTAVMIPVTALVDANDQQIVFVQYENFYEPVFVSTGESQGDLIEITEGLTIGEQLVTQGSLSLYAESRKSQTADADNPSEATLPDKTATPNVPVDAEELSDDLVSQAENTEPESRGFAVGILAAAGGGLALLAGAIAFMGKGRKNSGKNKGVSSDKTGDA